MTGRVGRSVLWALDRSQLPVHVGALSGLVRPAQVVDALRRLRELGLVIEGPSEYWRLTEKGEREMSRRREKALVLARERAASRKGS